MRFLDSYLIEDAKLGENSIEQSGNVHKKQMKSSNLASGVSNQKATWPLLSDGSSSSPGIVSSSIPVVTKARSKPSKDDLALDVNSRAVAGSRSNSNPKEKDQERQIDLKRNGCLYQTVG